MKAQDKIRIDGPAIGDKYACFAYIFSRLGIRLSNMVATFYEQGGNTGTHDPYKFLEYLDSLYIDPNSSARALDRL